MDSARPPRAVQPNSPVANEAAMAAGGHAECVAPAAGPRSKWRGLPTPTTAETDHASFRASQPDRRGPRRRHEPRAGGRFHAQQPGHQARRHARRTSSLQRLRLQRREQVAGAEMERRAEGHQELSLYGLRPRRADRLGLVALGRRSTSRPTPPSWPPAPARPAAPTCRRARRRCRTDFGTAAFGGACPPQGDKPHRYIFTVYALKTDKLDTPADASAALIGFMINANQLAKASFTAKYGR